MNTLADADIQRLVACLVLGKYSRDQFLYFTMASLLFYNAIKGYLEDQQLQDTCHSFCETSRHLTKEKKGSKNWNKPLETSYGLVKIVKEYICLKSRINDFLRLCPHSPVGIELIDTEGTLKRLDIILKYLQQFLEQTEKAPTNQTKKRRRFDISPTNTSTPEAAKPPKRARKSTPYIIESSNKELSTRTVASTSRSELYESSSETSGKDDDDIEEENEHSTMLRSTTSPVLVLKDKVRKSQVCLLSRQSL